MLTVYCEEKSPLLVRAAQAAAEGLALTGRAAVELVFMPADEMRALNRAARGVDAVTDVLSFPALDRVRPFTPENYPYDCNENGEVVLGSVVICRERAERQAAEYGHSAEREYAFLFVHGLLHLLGYDHIRPEDERVMSEAAERILSAMGLPRA